jgi:hypothetical protein
MKRSVLAALAFIDTVTSAQAQKPEAQPPGLMKAARIRRKLGNRSLKRKDDRCGI